MKWMDRLLRRHAPRPDTRTVDVLEKWRQGLSDHAEATERLVGPLTRLLTKTAKEVEGER